MTHHHHNVPVTPETVLEVGQSVAFYTRKRCDYAGKIVQIIHGGEGRGNGTRYVIETDEKSYRVRRGQITHVHH